MKVSVAQGRKVSVQVPGEALPDVERGAVLALVGAVAGAAEFRERVEAGLQSGAPVVLDHVCAEGRAFALAVLARLLRGSGAGDAGIWVVCGDVRAQEQLHAELAVWQCAALLLPRLAHVDAGAIPDPEVLAERAGVLSLMREGGRVIVTVNEGLDDSAPPPGDMEARGMSLSVGQRLDVERFAATMLEEDYERVPVVTERGQFARRGGIVDFFPWQAEEPVRVEMFDDEIESIREFDLHSQASVRRVESVRVLLGLADTSTQTARVRDHMRGTDIVITVDCEAGVPARACLTSGRAPGEGGEDFGTAIHPNPLGVFDASDFVLSEARRGQFTRQMAEWRGKGWQVFVFFHNDAERERFEELVPPGERPVALLGMLFRGFIVPCARLAVLTGAEIFGRHQQVRRLRGSKLDEAQALRKARDLLRDLREGDYVVHEDHGIGRFQGIEVREVARREEVLVIAYAEGGKVFVPLAEAHRVSRYVGVGSRAPRLNTLGDKRWARTRGIAERSVEEFAARMLTIHAERRTLKSFCHPPDTKWQAEFENSFVYRETPDQLRSVEEIKRDMEGERPMDRLLCADVGFGKTEVAVRAAFKAVMGGKQVAVLVPTTVLAQQHWQTIRERVSEFPVSVEMLCRLTPRDRERQIVKGIADGTVDIVVGTHRLISKDVRFKDLGLVVVDEEQRFGVKHKERFKELFRLIDVLTLSATPIPRTLYLALMGMRDMSTIETPPPNRHPVQTTVCPYDERVMRDAILAELERGGQVFLLHNRVQSIEGFADKIRKLCPGARVIVGHGQMDGESLEDVMHQFVEGRADVLVCTTIIESGVDIPNANTILIDRADRFGLADLYQLRGRVGRSGTRAHAYLMLPRDFVEGGDARKRVNAIKQYTELGSGFKIAMRDLEIRGAGNLLGTEQSGHIAAVGFDLYCQLLKQAVNKMQGRRVARPVEVALRADFLCLSENLMPTALPGTTPAFVPVSFIEDAKLRIQAYRAIGEVMTRRELEELEEQWRDQFGKLPDAVENLLVCCAIRLAASHAGITDVEIRERKLMLTRNGRLVQISGKFPRLEAHEGREQLREALALLRSF